MAATDVLADGFTRVDGAVRRVLDGIAAPALAYRADPSANTVAWLVWHLTRVQDDHVADAFDLPQVWEAEGWVGRFGLDLPPGDTGYGHSSTDVGRVVATPDLLAGYASAVHRRTLATLSGLGDGDLDRVVDEGWDPPVTLCARLVSVIADDLEHAGQAAYVRGLAERATR